MTKGIRTIDSRHNPTVKQLLRVAKHKEPSRCLLEGIHLCQAFLTQRDEGHRDGALPAQPELKLAIFQHKALMQALQTTGPHELKTLYYTFAEHAIILADTLFNQLCDVPSPQGVMLLLALSEEASPESLGPVNMVLLDRIQDPGNLGTILRTAAAAGIQHVALSVGCARPWSSKVLRSAQGAHFVLNIYSNCDLQQLLPRLAMPVYATTLTADAQSLYDDPLPNPCAWLFGNEGQGIDHALLPLVNQQIYIPQSPAIDSLNVAVASAIVLFEQRRQYV